MDLAFSPDGAALVCAIGDGTATAWDGLALTPKTFAKPSDEMLRTCAYSADGAVVAVAGEAKVIFLLDAATLATAGAVEGAHDGGSINALRFSANGQLASGGDDKAIKLWSVAPGGASATLVKAVDGAHRAAVMALAVTATGLASSSGDIDGQGLPNTLSVWT